MKLRSILWFSAVLLFIMILLSGCNWDLCTVNFPYDAPIINDPNGYAEPGLVTFIIYQSYPPLWCDRDSFALAVWEQTESDGFNDPIPDDTVIVTTRERSIPYPVPLEAGKLYVISISHRRTSLTGEVTQGPNRRYDLWTGPHCSTLNEMLPVELVIPGNEQLLLQSTYAKWLTHDSNSCYLGSEGQYLMQMGPDPEFQDPIFDDAGLFPNYIGYASFDNEFCVPYYWHVTTDFVDEARTDLDSGTNRFYIYPFGYDTVQPVTLLSPVDHAFIPAEELNFTWEEPTTCNRIFMYEIQVSEQADYSSFAYQMNSRVLDPVTLKRPKPDLEVCTQYYWRIMTDPPGDTEDIYSETRRFVLSDPQGPCPIEIPQFTPLPNDYLIVTSTPTVNPLIPSVTALENLNCRAGPGSVYKIDDTLMAGKTAPVEGRNDLSTWWYIYLENHKRHCWVWGYKAEFIGDVNQVPILDTPPTPIPDKPFCSAFIDEKTCELNPSCRWVSSVSRTPYCTEK